MDKTVVPKVNITALLESPPNSSAKVAARPAVGIANATNTPKIMLSIGKFRANGFNTINAAVITTGKTISFKKET